MFITALFTIVKIWKQTKCPSIDEQIKKMFYICVCVYIYTYIYIHTYIYISSGVLLSHKKNKILPFVTTWLDLEGTMLSEISQRKTNIILFHL